MSIMKRNILTKKLALISLIIMIVSLSTSIVYATDQLQTVDDFNLEYKTNDQFMVQSVSPNPDAYLLFTVVTGNLTATATLTMNEFSGTFAIAPTTTGTMNITGSSNIHVFVNGGAYTGTFPFNSGTLLTITWNMIYPTGPTPTGITNYNLGIQNFTYYLRSDGKTTNTITGYGLTQTNTASTATANTTTVGASVTYGFRVYTVHWNGQETELTNGTPQATMTRTTNGAGAQTATWTPTTYILDMGYDALKTEVYIKIDTGTWLLKGTYISDVLLYTQIPHQTWTFQLYTYAAFLGGSVSTSYSFGSPTYPSSIQLALLTPSGFELQTWYLQTGNIIMFILVQYTTQLGIGFYLLILLLIAGPLYVRHKNTGPVLLLFILFGGSGGIIFVLVPIEAALVVDALLVLMYAVLIWKVIR